jgi:hypothetical protein
VAKSSPLTVNFAIVSSAPIRSIAIDGVEQTFTKADTVLLSKTFDLKTERTVITVKVVDEKGRQGLRSYAVRLPGAPSERKFALSVAVEGRLEVDDNPTQDLSLPFPVSGFNASGVVKDSQQADTRVTLKAAVAASDGRWTAFGGAQQQAYGKASNEGLNTQVIYLGGSGRFNIAGTRDFLITYLYADVNVGTGDYEVLQTVTPALESRSEDSAGFYRHTYSLDYTMKDFASGTQTDGGQAALRWNYLRQNAAKLNSFETTVAAGNSTEGVKELDYTFGSGDFDWKYRWERGARFEWGLGYQYRSYANDTHPLTKELLGSTRVDNLFRASLGGGWQFNPKWSAMAGYQYVANISNKAPYVRSIYGVTVNGAF